MLKKIFLLKKLMNLKLDLKNDNGGNVKENIPTEEANELKARLEEAGAEVELK